MFTLVFARSDWARGAAVLHVRESKSEGGQREVDVPSWGVRWVEAWVGVRRSRSPPTAGCRVEDLFERSGASVGSFYHHFGSKPAVAAALHLEILGEFQGAFLAELTQHRSARAGIKALVRHHLSWVAGNPQRAAYLFQCLEPEVFAVCHEQEDQMTRAFFGKCLEWLETRATAGQIRKLSPLEYYVLWMGPTLELSRAWLMNVERKWTWMNEEQCRPDALLGAEKNLAEAAWEALRARR